MALALLAATAFAAVPADVAAQADKAGRGAGLAVVVGSSDGAAEIALAAGGRRLVQGLARDDAALAAARAAIRAKGLYGLASVVRPLSLSALPYADGLVDVVVVDVDALGADAPPAAELTRVLAPGGVALAWKGGAWTATPRARDPDLDDWTHFDHDAGGDGQSRDRRVGPPTQLQWRVEMQPYRLGGNPAGYNPYSNFRIADGRAFCIENQMDARTAAGAGKQDHAVLQARLAGNGIPLWRRDLGRVAGATHLEHHLVADHDRVAILPAPGEPVLILDARTGEQRASIALPAAAATTGKSGLPPFYLQLRLADGALVIAAGDTLVVHDATTGAARWRWQDAGGWPCFPRILPDGRVLVLLVAPNVPRTANRWPLLPTSAVVCLGLADGTERWRVKLPDFETLPKESDPKGQTAYHKNPAPNGPVWFGQSMVAGDDLFLFGSSGISGGPEPGHVACVDLTKRQLRWIKPTGAWGYNLVLREGRPYWFTPSTLYTADPATGAMSTAWSAGLNNRCNRSEATPEWVVNGMGIWVDRAGNGIVRNIARSGCAQGPALAQGLAYYTPNTCWCITQVRGHLALSAEPVRPGPDDAKRLRHDGGSVGGAAGPAFDMTGPIAAEWPVEFRSGATETTPVTAGGRSYVAVIHEHRLECRQGSTLAWSFTAGGRISQAPVVHGDAVLFGSHDGNAYCLDAATGALRWRFYAGGAERQLLSHGQVESSWPVYNVVIFKGAACFTAGIHPETGGGIYAWGVDPASGAVRWRKRFARTEIRIGKQKESIAPNRVLNRPLDIVDGRLAIIGLTFSPDEDDAAIQQRVDLGGAGDTNRNTGGWSPRGEELRAAK